MKMIAERMKVMVIVMVLVTVSLHLHLGKAVQLTLYHKVVASFPGDLGWCDLGSSTVASKITCGNLCSRHPNCSLFCFNVNDCQLYDARVSWHWGGVPGQPPLSSHCYSSWGVPRDAAPTSSLAAAFPYNASTLKEQAVNGYYCKDISYIYVAKLEAKQRWWAADLGTTHNIVSVKVQAKRFTVSYFTDVEVRVGNTLSAKGDFSRNPLLGFYSGTAQIGEVVTFTANPPIAGTVVSLQTLAQDFLALPSVQIEYV